MLFSNFRKTPYLCSTMAKKPFTPIPPMAELPPAEEINVQELLDKYLAGEIDLICVLGPTASGKTRYAVQLARQINALLGGFQTEQSLGTEGSERTPPTLWRLFAAKAHRAVCSSLTTPAARRVARFQLPQPPRTARAEIISADSRQVYSGMDIGTGKDLAEY